MDPDQPPLTPEQPQSAIPPVGQPMSLIGEQPSVQQQVPPFASAAQQPSVPPVGGSTPLQSPMPESNKSSSAWSRMLLFLVGFILLVAVAAGSYYLGVQRGSTSLPSVATKVAVPTAVPSVLPTITSSESAQIVKAGGVLGLKAYTASVPAGWTVSHIVKPDSDQLMIAKDGYTINIWEAGGDGGACSYPDHKITTGVIHGDYTTFTQITDQDGTVYRRGSDGPVMGSTNMKYTLCELSQGSFFNLTPYGIMYYTTPANPTEAMLIQMDAIVSTLKAQ